MSGNQQLSTATPNKSVGGDLDAETERNYLGGNDPRCEGGRELLGLNCSTNGSNA